jgi:hypothetical protein
MGQEVLRVRSSPINFLPQWAETNRAHIAAVQKASPSWVRVLDTGGVILPTYARTDWFSLTGSATGPTIEALTAWGRAMTLDNGYRTGTGRSQPLRSARTLLTTNYPGVARSLLRKDHAPRAPGSGVRRSKRWS